MPQNGWTSSASVLFDESHAEAWTIRPAVAREMQPSHPEDSSYAVAADALRRRGFAVAAHVRGTLTRAVLDRCSVLVIAHPSEPEWERTVPEPGPPRLSPHELDAIEEWVEAGGGLVLLAEEEQAKYGNNLGDLAERFGIGVATDVVSDYERHLGDAPAWVLAELAGGGRGGVDLLARVHQACFYRAGTLRPGPDARVLARASASASTPGAALLAVAERGAGRVAVAADSDLFGDDCIGQLDHEALWANLVTWAAERSLARPIERPPSPSARDESWRELKAATDALRLAQEPDGSVDLAAHDESELHELAERMAASVEALAPRFAHQADYLQAAARDIRGWADSRFGKPDFRESAELFRPELQRRDGIEHLVVFPMYLQNASRDRRFEALVVRVPWPAWLAELERTRYDNAKFVPVTFVDNTAGYDSECATLFPETFSVSGPPPNRFGAIFCDREAARFRRLCGRAAGLLAVNLPPDAAALLRSERLSLDAYMLWDLVHDRTHSHGDLPFDPFMIRQRMPYWMYSLEELRCDLTAFCEAVELERGGSLPAARNVQYAILFDRLFRFPIAGTRVRNYDGLGGQLLFAYLHRHGFVSWTDNRLTIDWDTVADGVGALRAAVEDLYRQGIDRPKVAQWIAAHDLVSTYVPATRASSWVADRRPPDDESEPRAWLDLVQDDEFPLSMFYTSLRQKLEPELEPA